MTQVGFGSVEVTREVPGCPLSPPGVGGSQGWSTQRNSSVAVELCHLQKGLEGLVWALLGAGGLRGLQGHPKSQILVLRMGDRQESW